MSRWLIEVQNPDGSFGNSWVGHPGGIAFDTAQVLLGLSWAAQQFEDDGFRAAAVRAGNWLIAQQGVDGAFSTGTFRGVPHAYDVYASRALLIAARLGSVDLGAAEETAAANARWAMEQRVLPGWYKLCGFGPDELPTTHTIAYLAAGLWGCGVMLDDSLMRERAVELAVKAAEAQTPNGSVAGTIGADWAIRSRSCCNPGLAQFAKLWTDLSDTGNHNVDWRKAAGAAESYLHCTQVRSKAPEFVRGGVTGSAPVYGSYLPFSLPSWAAKFYVDLLLRRRLQTPSDSDLLMQSLG